MYAVAVDVPATGKTAGVWRLYPIGDMHLDLKSCDEARLRRYLSLIAEDPCGMWVALGDYIDGTTPDHRYYSPEALVQGDLEQQNRYVAWMLERCEQVLSPLKGRPGVMLEGNHDRRGGLRWSGFTWELARRLGAQYGGPECLIRVRSVDTRRRADRGGRVWTVYARHGSGGGMYPGGKVNRMQNTSLAIARADIYLQAHVHDSHPRVLNLFEVTARGTPRLVTRPVALVIAPSFSAGRVQGVSSYVSEHGYPVGDQGLVYLEITNPHPREKARIRRVECSF
jgi:hypothetical protein